MNERRRGPLLSWVAVLALALAPAAALAAPPADGTAPTRRLVRFVVSAEAVASNVRAPPGFAGGGRLSAGVQFPRVRVFGVLEPAWPIGPTSDDARLDTMLLGGPGVGYLLRERALFYGTLLGGGAAMKRRDYLNPGSVWFRGLAGGARLGVSFRPVARDGRFRVRPTVGLALTALYMEPGSDPLTGARWGGWTPMVTVSVGAELRRSRVETPPDGSNAEAP